MSKKQRINAFVTEAVAWNTPDAGLFPDKGDAIREQMECLFDRLGNNKGEVVFAITNEVDILDHKQTFEDIYLLFKAYQEYLKETN